jgi:UDP-N-acetylmuramoyl-L-alanyl-D-glutamate--2,6-diaminopimelate ligase
VIGITGTNGKTSITYMIESVLKHAGITPGVIGTINYRWNDTLQQADNTTPESKDLQEVLARMRDDGVKVVVMEVSSHGLFLNRADDIEFDAAVFTNLTRDHLDFHLDFEEYFNAKMILFHLLDKSGKEKRVAVINTDDEYGKRMAEASRELSFTVKTLGFNEHADFRPDPNSVVNRITGLSYLLENPDKGLEIRLSLSGTFHIYNSLTAAAVLRSTGHPFGTIQEGLSQLKTVPGRFDVLDSGSGFHVIVDYAHTSDALLKLLASVNELEPRRLITVFGCGGDRDRTKRPEMGKIALDNSDMVIVTSDNPRTEDPVAIIEDITADLPEGTYRVVVEREDAIREAVTAAGKGDIVVIAGKGHEDYQIIGKTKVHFDDRELAAKYLAEKIAG